MKSFLTVFIAVALWSGVAQAQDFSLRFGVVLLSIPSVQVATELDFGVLGFGSRFTAGSWFGLVTRVSFDAYMFTPISEHWQVYGGLGLSSALIVPLGPLNDLHGLVGIRLVNGFFAEFIPRLFLSSCFQQGCGNCGANGNDPKAVGWGLDFGLGFSWRV